MLRKTIRRSGMLALVLALALAGTVPASATDFGGRNLDRWHSVWEFVMSLFGWDGDPDAGGVWEQTTPGFDPNGDPQPQGTGGVDVTPGFDPNGNA